MISYELSKQLKDAGFPQKGKEAYYVNAGENTGAIVDADMYKDSDLEFLKAKLVFISTLSELIEACGEGFAELQYRLKLWTAWAIKDLEGGKTTTVEGEGKTPEEAVAKLWLKLNEK